MHTNPASSSCSMANGRLHRRCFGAAALPCRACLRVPQPGSFTCVRAACGLVSCCRVCVQLSCCIRSGLVRAAVQAVAGHTCCCWRQQQCAGARPGASSQPASALTLPAGTDLRQGGTQVRRAHCRQTHCGCRRDLMPLNDAWVEAAHVPTEMRAALSLNV